MPFGAFGYRLCNGSERLFSASASLSEFLEPGIFGYPYLFCICHYCIDSTKSREPVGDANGVAYGKGSGGE